ncbi:cytochrome b [Halomonas cupida]|uniref:cytochrome b n=1 Tax=Halomonas cupida TaxID=44933 RepID=UPI0039B642E0
MRGTIYQQEGFSIIARILHWLMAIMVITMLFVGAGMVATVSERYEWLMQLHRPLGISILLLVVIRIGIRMTHGTPSLPSSLPMWQKIAARLSHLMLYGLMVSMPLIGWAMESAGGYPVTLFDGITLPVLVDASPGLYSTMNFLHTWLAYTLFFLVLIHFGAALFHALVKRDDVLSSMTTAARPGVKRSGT